MFSNLLYLPKVSIITYERSTLFLNKAIQKCFSSEEVIIYNENLIKSFLSMISLQYVSNTNT